MKLVAFALQKHPLLAARWTDDGLQLPEGIHIGIAVDAEAGLLVPVIRDVPSLGYEVYRVLPADGDRPTSSLSTNQSDAFMAEIHRDVIENEFFRIEVDAWNGAITGIKSA